MRFCLPLPPPASEPALAALHAALNEPSLTEDLRELLQAVPVPSNPASGILLGPKFSSSSPAVARVGLLKGLAQALDSSAGNGGGSGSRDGSYVGSWDALLQAVGSLPVRPTPARGPAAKHLACGLLPLLAGRPWDAGEAFSAAAAEFSTHPPGQHPAAEAVGRGELPEIGPDQLEVRPNPPPEPSLGQEPATGGSPASRAPPPKEPLSPVLPAQPLPGSTFPGEFLAAECSGAKDVGQGGSVSSEQPEEGSSGGVNPAEGSQRSLGGDQSSVPMPSAPSSRDMHARLEDTSLLVKPNPEPSNVPAPQPAHDLLRAAPQAAPPRQPVAASRPLPVAAPGRPLPADSERPEAVRRRRYSPEDLEALRVALPSGVGGGEGAGFSSSQWAEVLGELLAVPGSEPPKRSRRR